MRVPSCPRWPVTAVVVGAGYALVWHYSGTLPAWAIQASVIALGYAFLWCTSGQLVDFVLTWAQGEADRRAAAGPPDGEASADGDPPEGETGASVDSGQQTPGGGPQTPDGGQQTGTPTDASTDDGSADEEQRPAAGGQAETGSEEPITDEDRDVGVIVGKAENLLLPTFILAEAYTALSVIFAAKGLVRREDIQKNTLYYLAGTMTNFTYSIVVGVILRIALAAAGVWPLPL